MKRFNISAVALAVCFSLMLSLAKLLPIKVCAVSDSTIVYAAMEIIVSAEGDYGSINANDNGALSIGKVQWHATRALDLLKMIIAKNASSAISILGQTLYDEINSATDWSARTLSSAESTVVSQLLTTPEGIEAQDELAYNDILSYVSNAKALGITDPCAIVYFCDLNNQHGLGGAKRVAASASELSGSYAAITLATLHTAALADSTAGKYPTRRENVYNYVMSLDWETLETDIDIGVPYKRPEGTVGFASSDNDIRWLQTMLNLLGSYSLDVNGSFDGETQNALIEFETVCHLFANGEASASEIAHYAELLYIKANPKCDSFYTVTTNGANLNLRSTPSTSGSVLAKMPNGCEIELFSIDGDWAYVSYNGIMGYCSSEWITFKADNALTSLSVKSYPKTLYRFGEAFDFSRLILKATYTSGDYEYITSGFTASGNTNILGEGYVTITYQTMQTQIKIIVSDEISSIEICGTPQTEYTYGDEVSTDNMYIKVNYAGGASEYAYSGFEITADTSIVGQQSAVVTYCGVTAEYTITVADKLISLDVASLPKKMIYYYGTEDFDSTGLVLKADYASGSTKYIANGYKCFDFLTETGENPVYVLYDELRVKIMVYVVKYGDANLSKNVDSYDALYILQASAGLIDFNEYQNYASDVNYDLQINSTDALCLLKQIVYDAE